MAEIYNDKSNTMLSGTSSNDYVYNDGNSVTIISGNGNDSIHNNGEDVKIICGNGKNSIFNDGEDVTINCGDGDDIVRNGWNTYYGEKTSIIGGAGNDSIFNETNNVTINGGIGNDVIYNSYDNRDETLSNYDESNVLFKYDSGDGNDKIYGFKSDSTLSISGSSYSSIKSGDDIIVTVGNGKISLIGAASLSTINIDGTEEKIDKNSWKLSGTTAKYGNLVTVKGVKSTDGLSVNDKVVTVANSALNKKKVTVNNGYTLALADDVTKTATKKAAWTLKNSTATYKSSYKTAGYTLASNKKSISYSKATTAETLATIKGVKSKSGLKVSGQKITLKNSALNKKVTVSGGYEFDFASDYSKATITGSSSSDTITTRGKKISVNGGKGDDVIKIFGSGTVTGGKGADIFYYKSSGANVISDYAEEDKISIASGTVNVTTSGDDAIFTVGKGKITVEGGADKTITYFENGVEKTYSKIPDDVIYNAKGTAATLTAEYAADSFTPNEYSTYKNILVTIDASAVMNALEITGNKKSNFIIGTDDDDLIDGGTGADKILGNVGNDIIHGGAGNDSLNGGNDDDELYGDAGNDTILGGTGEDSLWGGKGTDTLYGGDGSDTFIYKNGDGKTVIADFDEFDTIMVLDAKVGSYTSSKSNVIFTVGNGQIVVQNAADKYIDIVDKQGNSLIHYTPR